MGVRAGEKAACTGFVHCSRCSTREKVEKGRVIEPCVKCRGTAFDIITGELEVPGGSATGKEKGR